MKVVLTLPTLADLEEIAEWIGRDDWDRADAFVDALERKCLTLSNRPRRCPLLAGATRPDLRKLTYRGYLIFYRVGERQVDILRIVHGARDWAAFLGEAR